MSLPDNTKKIRIAIIGCRGIPNHYGGFEQFATFLAPQLVARGFDVSVYCSSLHPYKQATYQGVHLIHCTDPEDKIAEVGQIYYDLVCIWHCRHAGYDIIFQLGYTSCGLWQFLLPKTSRIVSNMDGMEWQRSKYKGLLKLFLKFSERQVVERSDYLIGDAEPIKDYYDRNYIKPCHFLSYATEWFDRPDASILEALSLKQGQYFLIIARIQEDNNIEMIIRGYITSESIYPLVIIGNTNNTFGKYLRHKYTSSSIRWMGGVFDKAILDNLRYHTRLYFHGHSAGGTNPSLLEAMAASARIAAHDNVFNRSVCSDGAVYFADASQLSKLIQAEASDECWTQKIEKGRKKILEQYHPDILADQYSKFFHQVMNLNPKVS